MNERSPSAQAEIADDGALTFEQGVQELEQLFTPPAKESAKQQAPKAESESEQDATAQDAAPPAEEDEEQAEQASDAERSDEEKDEAEVKEPAVIDDDDALVAMSDGTRLTLRELKRNAVRDAVFTQKTQEIAAERQAVEVQSKRVLEHAAIVRQQRDLLIQYLQETMPQMPSDEDLRADPVGYLEKKATHEKAVATWQRLQQAKQADDQQQQTQMTADVQKWAAQQRQELYRHHPELNDPVKRDKVAATIATGMQEIGFSNEEWSNYVNNPRADHRVVRAMILASEMLALKKAGPKVAKQIGEKPKMLKPGKSATTGSKAQDRANAAFERLRKNPNSLEAGVDALLQFDNL